MILYMDDVLDIIFQPDKAVGMLGKYFKLNPGLVGLPNIYLGAKILQVQLLSGVCAWEISASQYIQESVKNVEEIFKNRGLSLKNVTHYTFSNNYWLECDVYSKLYEVDSRYYELLIGILRWAVKMVRIDIACEVSMMLSYVAITREGHFQQLFNMFA